MGLSVGEMGLKVMRENELYFAHTIIQVGEAKGGGVLGSEVCLGRTLLRSSRFLKSGILSGVFVVQFCLN